MSIISNSEYPSRPLVTARAGLRVLWIAAVVATLALVPSAFAATQADWQFSETVRSLGGGLSYEALAAIVTGIRLALAGLYLLTAGLLLARPAQTGSLIASAALTGMPFIANLIGTADAYPGPWDALLAGFALVLGVAGLGALVLLFFLFPDGRFYPARLRVPALAGMIAVVAGIIALEFMEDAWVIFMGLLLVVLSLSIVGQVLRYRAADPARRRQTIGFLISVLALPLWILFSAIGVSALLNLIAGYVVLALIPIGLFIAARRGLWGEPPSRRVFAVATGALLVVAAAAAGLSWRANQPEAVDLAVLNSSTAPVPVLFDTDMGMDDISALLYLLQHPAVDLRAITVNGVAFAHCDSGVRNVLGLLNVAGAPEIPVACGREESFPGGRPAPDDWRKSADKLYGAQVTTGSRKEDERPAAELLADTIAAAPDEITIIALGPLTNLAEAFQADPALAAKIKEIVIMGGAVDASGNVASEADGITNEFAEWNIFADPVAADIVLASGASITLIPLDATNDVPFTRGFYERLRAQKETRAATFTYNLMYLNQWWLDGGMYWWDTLATVAALDNSLITLREEELDVVTEAGPEIGRTVSVAGGAPVRVAVAADSRRFESLFLAVLNHE